MKKKKEILRKNKKRERGGAKEVNEGEEEVDKVKKRRERSR